MKHIFRYICAMLTTLLLLSAALLGLACYASTGWYAEHALGNEALIAQQQARIDEKIEELAAKQQVSPETLTPWTADAARRHNAAMQQWWHALWHSEEADTALPAFLSAEEERALIAAVMADEGFAAATPSAQRRAAARDDVAYAVDEIVCGAVTPLRRSVVDLVLSAAVAHIDLPMLARLTLIAAGVLLVLAMLLLPMLRKVAGSTLLSTAGLMAALSVPVWLLDIARMLRSLNAIAAAQGSNALLWLAIPWYGAALVLAAAGTIIIRVGDERL